METLLNQKFCHSHTILAMSIKKNINHVIHH